MLRRRLILRIDFDIGREQSGRLIANGNVNVIRLDRGDGAYFCALGVKDGGWLFATVRDLHFVSGFLCGFKGVGDNHRNNLPIMPYLV